MNAIGLFEAKTKFSEICQQVAEKGESVVVTRRGKPLVKIEPIVDSNGKSDSVWDRRAQHQKRHGRWTEDFTPPARDKQKWRNPLGD